MTNQTHSVAEGETVRVREAVGVFSTGHNFQGAVDELLSSGFDRGDLSLLAADAAVERELGHAYAQVTELEDNTQAPRICYVGKDSLVEARTGIIGALAYIGAVAAAGAVVASGGTVAACILAAVAAGGSGGVIGSLAARALGRDRAHSVQTQLDRGGLLLWVRVRDDDAQKKALAILSKHGGSDVHMHEIECDAIPETDPLAGLQPDPFLPARV